MIFEMFPQAKNATQPAPDNERTPYGRSFRCRWMEIKPRIVWRVVFYTTFEKKRSLPWFMVYHGNTYIDLNVFGYVLGILIWQKDAARVIPGWLRD